MNSITEQRNWSQALAWELNRYNWDCFGTGTFRKQRDATEARTLVERYWQDLEKRLQAPLPRFWVLEPHQHRETPHMHFLLANIKQINEDVEQILWDYWRKITSEARFQSQKYETGKGGADYLTKYLTKDIVDWDIANLGKIGIFDVENSLLSRGELDKMMRNELN